MVMHPHARRFRVGLIVSASTVLFLGLLAFIVGNSLTTTTEQFFVIYEENVKGMVVGSRVNYQGIPVGQVSDIRFQSGKTLVTLDVDPDKAVIQECTKARMDRLLVTGQVTIELEGYQPKAAAMKPGSVIEAMPDPMTDFTKSLPQVVESASGVIHEGHKALQNLNVLIGEGTQQRLAQILTNVEQASRELPASLQQTSAEAQLLVADARNAMGTLQGTLDRLQQGDGDVAALVADARTAVQSITDLKGRLDGTLADAQRLLQSGYGTVDRLKRPMLTMLLDFQKALDEVAALARVVKLAPDSLVFGRTENEIQVQGAAPLK